MRTAVATASALAIVAVSRNERTEQVDKPDFLVTYGALMPAVEVPADCAFVVKPDNTVTPIRPVNGKIFELAELQAYLDAGHIEFKPLPFGWLIVHEEGRQKKLPFNRVASMLFRQAVATWIGAEKLTGRALFVEAVIVGPCIVALPGQID